MMSCINGASGDLEHAILLHDRVHNVGYSIAVRWKSVRGSDRFTASPPSQVHMDDGSHERALTGSVGRQVVCMKLSDTYPRSTSSLSEGVSAFKFLRPSSLCSIMPPEASKVTNIIMLQRRELPTYRPMVKNKQKVSQLTVTRFELARETHHGFSSWPKRDAVTTWLHCHVWTSDIV